MYYPHSTSQPDNAMNQGIPSSSAYYPQSTNVLPMIPNSTTTDMTSTRGQQPASHSILSNPPLSTSVQVYDQHHQQQQQQQHHQELASHDTSLCSVLSSTIDEDVSSHGSSSLSGNRSGGGGGGGQDGYILQLQKQLEESKNLQTQYYYRIEQLMSLVEKQTIRISELQEQLANGHGGGTSISSIAQQQQQIHPSPTYHHTIQNQQHQQQHQQHH